MCDLYDNEFECPRGNCETCDYVQDFYENDFYEEGCFLFVTPKEE